MEDDRDRQTSTDSDRVRDKMRDKEHVACLV